MNAMLATILTIATVGVLAIPPPAQAASVYIDEFINSTTATKAVYIVGVRDGAAVFLQDVYAAEFRCSGVPVSTATEKVTSLMFAVPFDSWATTAAAPYVFYAMFDLGCKIETVAP